MDDQPLHFDEPPNRERKIKRTQTTAEDLERARRPGWKVWALSIGAALLLMAAFYAALVASRDFATSQAEKYAASLVGFIVGAIGAKVFHKNGEFRTPSLTDCLTVAPLVPLLLPIGFMLVWAEGEGLVVKEETICRELESLKRTDARYETLSGQLQELDIERKSRFLPTRRPDGACDKYLFAEQLPR